MYTYHIFNHWLLPLDLPAQAGDPAILAIYTSKIATNPAIFQIKKARPGGLAKRRANQRRG